MLRHKIIQDNENKYFCRNTPFISVRYAAFNAPYGKSYWSLEKRKVKPETRSHWGSKLLAGIKAKGKRKKSSPGQMRLPWAKWEVKNEEIEKLAEQFIFANCYNPQFTSIVLQNQNQLLCQNVGL